MVHRKAVCMAGQEDIYLLKSGDAHAFERIFRTYSRAMFFVAMGLVDDRQLAEDAVQESFVYLWNHRSQIDPRYEIQYYLKQSVRNYIFNYFRHRRVRERHAEALTREQQFWADGKTEEWTEKIDHVRKLLLSLPENCRKIFMMAAIEGRSYADTASELHVSVNTVKSQIKIAYRKLRAFRDLEADDLMGILLLVWLKYF